MRVLVVGDIIGSPGRDILKKYLAKYLSNFDLIIVNGENAAGGFGITAKVAEEFYEIGVDVITGGNHTWDKKDSYEFLNSDNRVLRPLNYPKAANVGKGFFIYNDKKGDKVAVINLQGRVFMGEIDSPFERVKMELEAIRKVTKTIIVDFHAEATSEKMALGWFLDGDVSLVFGTHTHVLTADNRILSKGTGYITDVGMTGGMDGIIGMKRDKVLERFLTGMPARFEVCAENPRINGIIAEIDDTTGKCTKIERVDMGEYDLR